MNQIKKGNTIVDFKVSKPIVADSKEGLLTDGEKSTKHEKLYVQLGSKIKELRTEQGLTRKELSLKLGVSLTYIALIEQGHKGGADNLLHRIEELFKLKSNTLIKLRDSGTKENLQPVEVETDAEAITEPQPITNHSTELSSKPSEESITLLMNALLSCDKDYVDKKIPLWLKEIQTDLFNQLSPYTLEDLKKLITAVTRNWINETEVKNSFEDGTCHIQGCITHDEQKYFFSLQLNEFALTLNLLQKDQHQAQYFEEWLGVCSISYSMQQILPYTKTKEVISHYLWFNPQVSIIDMFGYLKDLPINLDRMHITEPRLNWYISPSLLL
ncbi:helix-turn-helix transcriptional regulator [Solibacillus sp. FSL R5-0691]|uniref:helix-turn-helix domain-containing protein n=1 Tax=Solibacillus sp. FSL R5-0691 TaxID=2921653 RepID=UPI0030CB922A